MRTPIHRVGVILPTSDVLYEYSMVLPMMGAGGLFGSHFGPRRLAHSFEDIAQYIIHQWASVEISPWAQTIYRPLSTYDQVLNLYYTDYIEKAKRLIRDDAQYQDVQAVLLKFIKDIYHAAVPILEAFQLTDQQLSTLDFDDPVGRSLVVLIDAQ